MWITHFIFLKDASSGGRGSKAVRNPLAARVFDIVLSHP